MKARFENPYLVLPLDSKESIKSITKLVKDVRKIEDKYFADLCKSLGLKFKSPEADILWGLVYLNDKNCIKYE
jgi:hypothetical protein